MEMVSESAEDDAGYPELWKSVYSKDEVKMKTLLEGGANTEILGGWEFRKTTPLQMAVEMNQISMVKTLLKHGANVHVRTNFGDTLLHKAVSTLEPSDALGMVRVLQKNHAVVDAKNHMGWTALHEATLMRNITVIGYLMGCKADVTLKTLCGLKSSDITLCPATKDVLREAEVKAEEAQRQAEEAQRQAAVNDSCLAFAMGHHKRLGQGTEIIDLHPDLLRMVLRYRGV